MSCYLRHLKDVLDEAGITVTPANRKQIDRALHQAAGTDYQDCPATWRQLKSEILVDAEQRGRLIQQLKQAAG
ncbi:MAG: hypothetical protein V1780_01410 [Chloroflexota bacterium]